MDENIVCELIQKKETGYRTGEISCQGKSVFIHPGVNKPSRMKFSFNKTHREIKMVFSFRDPEKVAVSCRDIDGEIGLQMNADGKKIYQEDINYKQQIPYQLDLKGIEDFEIVVDKGKNGSDCDWFLIKDILIH